MRFKGDDEVYKNHLLLANKAYERQKKEEQLINRAKAVFKDNPSKYDEILSLLDGVNEKYSFADVKI